MAISFVPAVGSALQVAFNEAAGRRLADRRTAWLNGLAEKVHALEEQIGDFAKLVSEDTFMDALTTASQIADRTSRVEKLEVLRNAVVNSVMPDAPDADTQQLFFDMLDRFTVTHVRMLTLLSNPTGWFERTGLPRPNMTMGARERLVEIGMQELISRRDLIRLYAADLNTAGLIDPPVTAVVSENRLWENGLTLLGRRFLAFVTEPESKVHQAPADRAMVVGR